MVTMSKEYSKAYYDEYKKTHPYVKKTIVCDCGMEINKTSKYYHAKTKNHFQLLERASKANEQTL